MKNKYTVKSNYNLLMWLNGYICLNEESEKYFPYIDLDEMQKFIDQLSELYVDKYSDDVIDNMNGNLENYLMYDTESFKSMMKNFDKKCYYFLKGRFNGTKNQLIRNNFPCPRPNEVVVTAVKVPDGSNISIYIRTKDAIVIKPNEICGIKLGKNCKVEKLISKLKDSDINYDDLSSLHSNFCFNLILRDKLLEMTIEKIIHEATDINYGYVRANYFLKEIKSRYKNIDVELKPFPHYLKEPPSNNSSISVLYKTLELHMSAGK